MEEKLIDEKTMLDELTDTQRRMRAIQIADAKAVLKEVLPDIIAGAIRKERQSGIYKFLSKVFSNILGILKDPEL